MRVLHKDSAVSIVGCYPRGDSALGIQDMAGNVAEWVRAPEGGHYYVGGYHNSTMEYILINSKLLANLTVYELGPVGIRCVKDI